MTFSSLCCHRLIARDLCINNISLNLRKGKQTLTMLLKQSNKGHLGQSVKIVCCICKTVYYCESISSSKPVNTSESSLNFVRVDWYTYAVDKLRKLQPLYDIAHKNLKKIRNGEYTWLSNNMKKSKLQTTNIIHAFLICSLWYLIASVSLAVLGLEFT